MPLRTSLLLTCCAVLFAADDDGGTPVYVLRGGKIDPAVVAAATATAVPWAAGDRILLVGDLHIPNNQPELALRLQQSFDEARPDLGIVVFSLMNHGVTTERWRDAAKAEISRRPPNVVVVMPGVGDVEAAASAKSQPTSPESWRTAVAEIIKAAQAANAAVVVATPAVYTDKSDGFGANELDAYADAGRALAAETKSVLCDIHKAVLEYEGQKNPKGSREMGVLCKAPGQLKPEGLDIVAGLVAKSLAEAAVRIPWSVSVPDVTFTGAAKAIVVIKHGKLSDLTIHHTVDGTDPTADSPAYTAPVSVSGTTELRILAVDKAGRESTAAGWAMELRKHASERNPPETLPGVWVDHYTFPAWVEPAPALETMQPDYQTWWPNCETAVCGDIPNHRYTETCFGLRFTGYFLAPYDGIYVFATDSDDTTRLSIDDLPVLHCDGLHAPKRAQGALDLNRGMHTFSLYYAQGPGPYFLGLSVAMPGQRFQAMPDQLLYRPAKRPLAKDAKAAAKPDPAAFAPMTGSSAWEARDRILLIGDLLDAPGQTELAVRIDQAFTAAMPDKHIVVHSLMNRAYGIEQWRDAAKTELAKRPPELVVILGGVGDVLKATEAKGTPISADTWRNAVSDIVKQAQAVNAAVVIATPAIVGDKPAEGPGAKELDDYAEAARKLAADTKSELCDLRKPLLDALAAKNADGAKEDGILSAAPGQLNPAGMDIVAKAVARAMGSAALSIPWSLEIPDQILSDGVKAEIRVRHGAAANLTIYYTTDDGIPSEKSQVYNRPLGIGSSCNLKALAIAKDGSKQTASGWMMKVGKNTAEAKPPEALPGLWVDHYSFRQWRDPIPPLEAMKPDFETTWPNTELAVDGQVPNHRWPEVNFGLRFTGYFYAPVAGTYIFSTDSDDSTRLKIGSSMFIKNDDLHAARAEQNAIELDEGYHPLTLLYGEGPGVIKCDVKVGLQGQRLRPLPDLLLRRPPVKPKKKELSFQLSGGNGADADPGKDDTSP